MDRTFSAQQVESPGAGLECTGQHSTARIGTDATVGGAIPGLATAAAQRRSSHLTGKISRSRSEEMLRDRYLDFMVLEEAEHSRLLGCAVRRFGGRIITSHWSFTAFCLCRRVLGVRFELQVLTLTELVSTAYYRMLRAHSPDGPLAAMCELILRDEGGHVAFQRDRLAGDGCPRAGWRGWLWQLQFLACGYAAGTVLWISHAACLKAIGGTRGEFYLEITRQMTRFIRALHKCAKRPVIPALWAKAACNHG